VTAGCQGPACSLNCDGPCPAVHTEGEDVEVLLCGDGPALVRGAHAVYDLDGRRHLTNRPVVGVCLCGRSQRGPWCDGTHKFLRRRKDRPAPA
jgi:hypothetical protein